MKIIPVISGNITDAVQTAFTVGANRAKTFEGEYHKEVLEVEGITVTVDVRDDVAYVIIQGPDTVVFIHPRQGPVELFSYYTWESGIAGVYVVPHKLIHGVAGGWTNGVTPLTGQYIYPLTDEDNASYLLTSEDANSEDITGEFAGSSGNYGNLYWYNGDDDDPVFLSWKGTPTRHFRLPNNVEINGFSIQETALKGVDEDMPVFTAFGNKIYQDGSVLYTAPRWNWPYTGQDRCFVLGAMQDSDGTVWAVMQSDRYNVPKYITYFSDGHRIASDNKTDKTSYLSAHSGVTIAFEKEYPVKKGIFTMLWEQGGPVDGWTFISEWNTGRQGLPWFGNKSGTEFVNPLGSRITVGGSKTDPQPASGTYKEEMTGGESDSMCSHGKFLATYTDKDFYEFSFDTLVYGSRSLAFSAVSLKTHVEAKTKVYDGSFDLLYNPDDPAQAPTPLWWDINNHYVTHVVVNGQALSTGARGGQGTLTVTTSGFTVDSNNIINYQAPCTETNSAMGSITVTDSCGDSITREVRLGAVGVWITVGWTYFGCTGLNLPSGTCDWPLCGNHWSMDTTCKFLYTSTGNYASSGEINGSIKRSASWGCFNTAFGSTYQTTLSGYYYGNRGSAPPPPEGVTCSGSSSLLPNYQVEEHWVCP